MKVLEAAMEAAKLSQITIKVTRRTAIKAVFQHLSWCHLSKSCLKSDVTVIFLAEYDLNKKPKNYIEKDLFINDILP